MDINLVELIGQLVELIIRWHVHFYVSLVADLYGFTGSIESSKSIVSIYMSFLSSTSTSATSIYPPHYQTRGPD